MVKKGTRALWFNWDIIKVALPLGSGTDAQRNRVLRSPVSRYHRTRRSHAAGTEDICVMHNHINGGIKEVNN